MFPCRQLWLRSGNYATNGRALTGGITLGLCWQENAFSCGTERGRESGEGDECCFSGRDGVAGNGCDSFRRLGRFVVRVTVVISVLVVLLWWLGGWLLVALCVDVVVKVTVMIFFFLSMRWSRW